MAQSGWSKEDYIRWVEHRLRERCAADKVPEDDLDAKRILDAKGIPDAKSLEVWLAKERDGLSWQQIVIKYYRRQYRTPTAIKTAGISKARRVHRLVTRRFKPTERQSFKYHMEATIREVFGCTPQAFKRYFNSIRIDKRDQ